MTYLAVKDLKKTKQLWEMLASEKELVITKDGKPSALLISISPETLDESLRQIRQALFSAAVGSGRRQTEDNPPDLKAIEEEIRQSREERGIS